MLCGWGLALSMVLSSSAVHADEHEDARANAINKYDEGSRAFAEKNYKEAIDLFLDADSLVSSAALAYNISLAYGAMSDAPSSLKWAREYLRRAPDAEDRLAVEKRIDGLESDLAAKGLQQVTVNSTPTGALVVVDDATVGVTPWTGELKPGNHRIELRLTHHEAARSVFDLRPDRALDVKYALVRMNPSKPSVSPTGKPPEVTTARHDTPARVSQGSGTVVAFGVATLATGAIGFGAAIGLEVARAASEAAARGAADQVDAMAELDGAEDLQLGARVAVGVGGGLVLAGGAMLIAGLVSDEALGAQAPKASAACNDDGCVFGLTTRF